MGHVQARRHPAQGARRVTRRGSRLEAHHRIWELSIRGAGAPEVAGLRPVLSRDVDGIAVTAGPGLVGSLLVGVSYAKAMAYALEKPFVGVNHIEGHIYSVAFENPPIEYPAEALTFRVYICH